MKIETKEILKITEKELDLLYRAKALCKDIQVATHDFNLAETAQLALTYLDTLYQIAEIE